MTNLKPDLISLWYTATGFLRATVAPPTLPGYDWCCHLHALQRLVSQQLEVGGEHCVHGLQKVDSHVQSDNEVLQGRLAREVLCHIHEQKGTAAWNSQKSVR